VIRLKRGVNHCGGFVTLPFRREAIPAVARLVYPRNYPATENLASLSRHDKAYVIRQMGPRQGAKRKA
jgi:hypothetical protein